MTPSSFLRLGGGGRKDNFYSKNSWCGILIPGTITGMPVGNRFLLRPCKENHIPTHYYDHITVDKMSRTIIPKRYVPCHPEHP